MNLKDEVTLLDPFTHTKQDNEKIKNFDFIRENSKTEREKISIDESFCTLIAVGGKFLEEKTFKKVLKKIDEIRRIKSEKKTLYLNMRSKKNHKKIF